MNMSATLNALEIMKNRKEKGLTVFNFGLGENPFPVPEILQNELIKSSNIKHYENISGDLKTRNKVKDYYSNEKYKVDNVIFANGSKELLFMMQMIFDGIIILVSPYWVSYIEHSKMLNKKYEIIETKLENDFKIDPNDLLNLCNKYPNENKLLILNSPNNPTGLYYKTYELKILTQIIQKNNIIVYSDELYNKLVYEKDLNETDSICNYCPENTIRSHSLSKIYGLGGWRCGWATFPKKLEYLYKKMKICGVSIYTCVTTPLLNVVFKAIDNNDKLCLILKKNKNIFKSVINLVYNKLIRETKLKLKKPDTAWYMFISFENYSNLLEKNNINDSYELVNDLIDKIGFVCVAGQKFGNYKWFIRISLIDLHLNKLGNLIYDNILWGIDKLITYLNNLK